MEFIRSPKGKLLLAALLLISLSAAASLGGMSAASTSRWALGAVAVGASLWWTTRSRTTGAGQVAQARLSVIGRAGLSQRCGVALVEADGRAYLVVHGEGYAEVCEAKVAVAAKARRPRPLAGPMRLVRRGGAR